MAQDCFTCGDQIADNDGNTYETVQIGSLCWTKSNMKAKTYADGSAIAKALVYRTSMYPDTNANLETYGRLYTWYSAVNVPEGSTTLPIRDTYGNVQGICPDGWHIPTVNEMAMLNNLPAEDLKSTELWLKPNNNTNSTGFSSLPAGVYTKTLDSFEGLLGQTYYWSESKSTPEYAVACDVNYYCNVARDEQKRTGDAISVRCLRNENGATTRWQSCPGTPTVTDHEGNVYNTVQIGNQCWTRENLRTTTSPSTGAKLVNPENFTDNQATRSYTSKAAFWYMNDSAMYAPKNYGLHYNWCAAVDTFRPGYPEVATYSNINSYNYWNCTFSTNHRRGICPEGWHIPSDDEWTQLINYVKSQSTCNYLCNNDISNFAKALSSTEGWEISLETCAVGNNPSDNNATGFSLVPAGFCSGNFSFAGQTSYLWSSTQRDSGSAWSRNLDYNLAAMHRNAVFKYYPRSVRCLRD